MKKLLLFPYHPDVELLAEKTKELEDVSVVGVCSFREDQAAADAVNQRLGCTGSFTELLEKCDTLLLLDDYREIFRSIRGNIPFYRLYRKMILLREKKR